MTHDVTLPDDEFRAHLIEVGRDAMGRNDGWRWWHPRHLARLLDFWEPLIRADERRMQFEADPSTAKPLRSFVAQQVDSDPEFLTGMESEWRRLVAEEIVEAINGEVQHFEGCDAIWDGPRGCVCGKGAAIRIARRIGGAS